MSGTARLASRLLSAAFLTWCILALPANLVGAEESSLGSRIKFLDDLLCWGQESTRDPWEERIETERHDFTQSATTVGRGVSQVELGYSYFYTHENEEIEQAHTTPELMLRFGLSDDIEFRVRWTYAWVFPVEEVGFDASEDMRWSFKLQVTEQEEWIPQSALELRFTAPLGGRAFSTTRVDWGLDYIYDWELCEGWRFYGSTGVSADGLGDFGILPEEPDTEHFTVMSQSFALETHLTERMTMYNEFYGLFSHQLRDDFNIVFYNIGVDYYLTDDLVLDVRVGKGLTPESDDLFGGIGGGFRF